MEMHEQDSVYTDLDFDVQQPEQRTASTRSCSNKKHRSFKTKASAARHQKMNCDGGSLIGKAALAAVDTRVILGALLGWTLVSKLLKRLNTPTEDSTVYLTAKSSLNTPHASILETEVKSLRKSLQNLRADNLALAAQVAQLHGGMIRIPRNNMQLHQQQQRTAGPKALHDAFEAAAIAGPSSSSFIRSTVDEQQDNQPCQENTAEISLDPRRNNGQEGLKTGDVAELSLLQQENEQLLSALEQLRLENEEMAQRMLEVAFRGSDAPINELSDANTLNQLGELRNVLISEAGGLTETDDEWLEMDIEEKEQDPEHDIGNKIDNDSFYGGPTTPEVANESAEANGNHGRRHIPAAAYLED